MGDPLARLAEPAGLLGAAEPEGRSAAARAWDAAHRPTSYRLDERVPERVREIQGWYRARGYTVSLSQLVEDLLLFAFGAWERGDVAVNVKEDRPRLLAVRRE